MDLILPRPGTYVVAVSGGVDSMTLLHLLQASPGLKLVVAHLDHGIRPDSAEDRQLVQATARASGLPFVYQAAGLGAGVSEDTARRTRYDFLYQVRQASGARAIITAHHQDDLLETAIINLLRGTGRSGLTALGGRHDVERPLLAVPKAELLNYAQQNGLSWREDSTNCDENYLRNYVRRRLVPQFDPLARQQFLKIIDDLATTNRQLDTALVNQLHSQSVGGQIDRTWFNHLPHAVAREVMATWLRARGLRQFDKKALERLVVAAKTARPGQKFDVKKGWQMAILKSHLALVGAER